MDLHHVVHYVFCAFQTPGGESYTQDRSFLFVIELGPISLSQ